MIHVNRDANIRKSKNYKLSLLQYPPPPGEIPKVPTPHTPLLAKQNMQAKEVYF